MKEDNYEEKKNKYTDCYGHVYDEFKKLKMKLLDMSSQLTRDLLEKMQYIRKYTSKKLRI
jgi:GH24 family phage-related lysozyme (muramidase)